MNKEDVQEIVSMGYDVWGGDYDKFFKWLTIPCPAMGGKAPIEYNKEEIITEINRIKYGIFC
jgi:uncharacterized protein (DUF2384 family)